MSSIHRFNSHQSIGFSSYLPKMNFSLLEKIAAVALSVFAASVSKTFFAPWFAIGVGLGIYQSLEAPSSSDYSNYNYASPTIMERLTGVRLPNGCRFVAQLANTVSFIEMAPQIFVPMTGAYAGAWVGYSIMQLAR